MEKATLDKALDMLGAVAAKLGQTAQTLFPEVVRYLMMQQVGITIALLLAAIAGSSVAYYTLSAGFKNMREAGNTYGKEDTYMPYFVFGCVSACMASITTIIFLVELPVTIAAVSSPMGFATMKLIGK